MGKRKSSKAPPKKAMQKVPTTFNCPFCNHEGSVECRLDREKEFGELHCRICNEKYRTLITRIQITCRRMDR
eukprot:jgi/Chlat1/9283/Chrsp99S09298